MNRRISKLMQTAALVASVGIAVCGYGEAKPLEGVSVFYWTIQDLAKERNISISEACKLMLEAGVTGFDCDYADKALPEVTATGLKPINLFGQVNFRAKDGGERQMREFLDSAVSNGVPRIMVIPDYFSDGEPHEDELREITEGLRKFVAKAKPVGVTVTVETFGGKKNPCSYAKYVKHFMREIPDLGFALDTGNLYFAGRGDDVREVAHFASNRIAHVHLKDWKKGLPPIGPGSVRNYETIGLGAIPNEELVRYAKQAGFRGWYTLEHPLKGDTLGDVIRQIAILEYWLKE